ncbi:hypothetical protein [Bradyrhizobium sp. CW1]|uniref:hypothetical protein n=1 Tax=Bradyrhizobium sp. CW1 TaxID=2782686 RepID=UPI001FFFC483|nr:hypothetical protein [Bradyrhizobium sp. CW1]
MWDATKHLHLIVTYGGSTAADLDLGLVDVLTPYTIDWTAATNRFAARLNTGASLVDSVGQMPGVGALDIARSPTSGETFDGTISRWTLFATERLPPDVFFLEGDSYPAGVSGVSITGSLAAASGRGAFTTAVGGSDLQTEVARVLTHLDLTGAVYIHWDGDANNWIDVATTMSYYAQLVASLKTSKFIIIPPCRRNNKTAGDNAGTLQIQ